jgi:hypothetical protein
MESRSNLPDGWRAALKRLLTRFYPLLSLLTVVGITTRIYWNLPKAADITFADEAFYLTAGQRFLHEGVLPTPEYSPLYAVWYSRLLALFGDAVRSYHAQILVVVFLTALVVYWYLRLIEVPRSLSVLGTLMWVAQPAYIGVNWGPGWPRPYHFALLLFLTGAVVLRRLKAQQGIPIVLYGTSFYLLAFAVRVEYLAPLVCYLCSMALLARSRLRRSAPGERRSYWWAAALFAGTASLLVWMHVRERAASGEVERLWFAFGQHFSVFHLGAGGGNSNLSPWDDWQFIVGRVFPGAHSFWTAAVANPKDFCRFELSNLISTPRTLFGCFTNPYLVIKALVGTLAAVWITFLTATGASTRRRAILGSGSALGPYVLSAAAISFPAMLVTTRLAYLLPLLFVLFAGALKWLSIILEQETGSLRSLIGLSAVALSLLFAVMPSPFDAGKKRGMPNYSEMTEIGAVVERERPRPVPILQVGGTGYSAFLPYGLALSVEASDRRDNERFWDFLDRSHVGAVLVDDHLRLSRLYRDDPDFRSFLHSPGTFGWTAQSVGVHGDVLYAHAPEAR